MGLKVQNIQLTLDLIKFCTNERITLEVGEEEMRIMCEQ